MGIYFNPGKQSFQMAVNSEIFVDKTEMIRNLNAVVNTQQRFICVSRPRRFGKTMAADMICAYYDREAESRTLFSERKIANTSDEKYDGYRVSDAPSEELLADATSGEACRVFETYCPLSVVNAALYKRLENYWNKTETYEALADYIRRNFDGLKDTVTLLMNGGRYQIDTSTYQNDMTTFHSQDDILSLLIHLGYLGYDDENKEVFIPNREIMDEFRTSTKDKEWAEAFEAFKRSQELLNATVA